MERVRGSSEVPLSQEGLAKAHEVGMQLAQKGGVDRIVSSDLGRTVTTARAINRYTRAPITHLGPELHPWHLGGLEGKPVTEDVIKLMNDRVVNSPDKPIPGMGPESTYPGESFNSFKMRTLPFIDQLVREHMGNPNLKTAAVTHYRVKKLVDAWLNRGAHADWEIDPQEMVQQHGHNVPGGVDRLYHDQNVGMVISPVDMESPSHLQGGIYLIRHAPTAWNSGDTNSVGSPS